MITITFFTSPVKKFNEIKSWIPASAIAPALLYYITSM